MAKSSSSTQCSAIHCKNYARKNPELSFFRFPRDEERCKNWLINSRIDHLKTRPPSQLNRSNYLCAKHFEDSQFTNTYKDRLNWNAIPTLFDMPTPSPKLVSKLKMSTTCETVDESHSMGDEMETDALNKPLYMVANTFEELESSIWDYEIEHTVHFVRKRGNKLFNANHEPWVSPDSSLSIPKLTWSSDRVSNTGHPYFNVATKLFECQYGRPRNYSHEQPKLTTKGSYKIGCPCFIQIVEVIRLVSPKLKLGAKEVFSQYRKKELSRTYKEQIMARLSGQPSQLYFKREFHMTISPLSSHKHVIGEAAAEHEKVDPIIVKRMHELAASGITDLDVIQDNISHYVEEVVFKDKTPPIKTNRRFYPQYKDIRNHVYLTKNQLCKQNKVINVDNEHDLAMAVNSILDNQMAYETGEQQKRSHIQLHDTQTLGDQSFDDKPYEHVSSYCSVNTAPTTHKPQPAPATTLDATTSSRSGWKRKRNSKEKFLCLVNKLNRISQAIDGETDFTKLSTLLVNVIVQAKSLVPPDQVEILFQEEPRQLLHARRIRKHRPKKRIYSPKPRYPEINPEATLLPDKKKLKVEAKERELEAKTKRAVEVKAAREKSLQLKRLREQKRITSLQNNPTKTSANNTKNAPHAAFDTKCIGLTVGEMKSSVDGGGPKVLLIPVTSMGQQTVIASHPLKSTTTDTSRSTKLLLTEIRNIPKALPNIQPRPPMQIILKSLSALSGDSSHSPEAESVNQLAAAKPEPVNVTNTILDRANSVSSENLNIVVGENTLTVASVSTPVSGGASTSSVSAVPLSAVASTNPVSSVTTRQSNRI